VLADDTQSVTPECLLEAIPIGVGDGTDQKYHSNFGRPLKKIDEVFITMYKVQSSSICMLLGYKDTPI
jgi:hypothetical protein